MKKVYFVIILIFCFVIHVQAENEMPEPAGELIADAEEAETEPGSDAGGASLAGLYEMIAELKSELAERDRTEPQTEPSTQPPTTADGSSPRLMAAEYTVENGCVTPDGTSKLTVLIRNTNKNRSVYNVKLTLTDPSGELTPSGMGTAYVAAIDAGRDYTFETTLIAACTAAVGLHDLTLNAEYEDDRYASYTSADTIRVEVRQPARLSFDGAVLPAKAVQGDTVTVTVNLMNTGKSTLYNCKVDFAVEGLFSGGSAFAGELASGESRPAAANLRVSSEKTGKVKGRITVRYEDAYGKLYTQTADVETVIEKKVETAIAPREETKQRSLWWVFLSAGAVAGAVPALAVPAAIRAAGQRREDEKRL